MTISVAVLFRSSRFVSSAALPVTNRIPFDSSVQGEDPFAPVATCQRRRSVSIDSGGSTLKRVKVRHCGVLLGDTMTCLYMFTGPTGSTSLCAWVLAFNVAEAR